MNITLEEILSLEIKDENIAILGAAGSGKSFLANELKKDKLRMSHRLHCTDWNISFGFKESMYVSLEEIKAYPGRWVAEGVQMYRMLRKCLELGLDLFQIVIVCERGWNRIEQTYIEERKSPEKIKYLKKFHLQNQVIFNTWESDVDKEKVQIIYWDNTY